MRKIKYIITKKAFEERLKEGKATSICCGAELEVWSYKFAYCRKCGKAA